MSHTSDSPSTDTTGVPLPSRGRPVRAYSGRPVIVLCLLALGVIALDQATKAWATGALADSRRIDLLGHWLGLVLVRNPGAAFSFATGQTWIFSAVALIVAGVVIRVARRLRSMWWAVTLGLVLGGAVGNLIDRLVRAPGVFRGHVVDFIDYGGLFVGNVADVAIVGAAVAIVLLSLAGIELDGTRSGDHDAGQRAAAQALGADAPTPAERPVNPAGADARAERDERGDDGAEEA